MFKKILVFVIMFFMLGSTAMATDEDVILGVVATMVNSGVYNSPKWVEAFKLKNYTENSGIIVSQITPDNIEVGVILISSRTRSSKCDFPVTKRLWSIMQDFDLHFYEYPQNDDESSFRYKFSGNKIYKYDEPSSGWYWSILGIWEFEEEGNLLATYDITDDGKITKYDSDGKPVVNFIMKDTNHIYEFDANNELVFKYEVADIQEFFRTHTKKKNKTVKQTPVSENLPDIYIIPLLTAFSKYFTNEKYDWIQTFKNISSARQINKNGNTLGRYSISSSSVDYYDRFDNWISHFDLSGSSVYYYDKFDKLIGRFNLSGSTIDYYDKYDNRIGYFYLSNSSVDYYNSNGKWIAKFDISGSTITLYDTAGRVLCYFYL